MSRRILAGLLTIGVLAAMVGLGARRPSTGTSGSPAPVDARELSPEDRLRRFIDAARAGDIGAYLDAFAEPLRSRIAREMDEAGRDASAAAMRRASEARKGYALYAAEPDGPDAVRIALESVYPDRNERQLYRLERGPGGWKIAAVESARGREPAARYGSPASYREPEGVPVSDE